MGNFTWDDLQFFLAVARSGQLSRAARQLRTSHVTVSRRIDRLEAGLKMRLFERNPRGYELTAVGRRLIETAERMEAEAERMQVDLLGDGPGQRGVLRMAVPEGFGSWFSRVLLPPFTQRFPNIALELITLPQIMSLSRREADLTVTLDPPKASPYHSERITDYSLHIYAARDYLAAHAPILGRADLLKHPFIGYIEEMIFAPGLDYLGEIHPGIRAQFKSSSIFNQLAATRNGLGLCVLPFYVADMFPDLEMVLPQEVALRRTYWLTCHRDVRPLPRERSVMTFLLEAGHSHGRSLLNLSLSRKSEVATPLD
ncbi:LysR family transcriptional regulator [Cereibacter sphaeroides]|uniref:LysR family transcriptional regulator n=1 Tax=Cereibacter sphaeroides TaxID=1063 RepID=UPI001F1E6B50|nr:LysR family transcriptional regulator [Cereibacter sphaeroides]MCE6970065.1 LysR family transcriptional regulator [Cereibacter sphaeroides]